MSRVIYDCFYGERLWDISSRTGTGTEREKSGRAVKCNKVDSWTAGSMLRSHRLCSCASTHIYIHYANDIGKGAALPAKVKNCLLFRTEKKNSVKTEKKVSDFMWCSSYCGLRLIHKYKNQKLRFWSLTFNFLQFQSCCFFCKVINRSRVKGKPAAKVHGVTSYLVTGLEMNMGCEGVSTKVSV